MHEASLTQGLVKLALESWEKYNESNPGKPAGRIKEIKCSYGLLAGFEPETLQLCFELFTENTPAENSELILVPEPLACHCGACGKNFKLSERHFICPECGGDNISFKGGNGLTLQSINVENEEKGHD